MNLILRFQVIRTSGSDLTPMNRFRTSVSVRPLSEIRMELAPRLRVVDKVAERWPACQSVRPSATGRARPRRTNRRIYYWHITTFLLDNRTRRTEHTLTTTSHMATETEQLKRNAEDQITRLITQLSDLEELREVRDNTSQRVWAGAWA